MLKPGLMLTQSCLKKCNNEIRTLAKIEVHNMNKIRLVQKEKVV